MTQIIHVDIEGIRKKIEEIDTDLLILITETTVWNHYSKILDIKGSGKKRVILFKAAEGEKAKTIEEFSSCVEFLLEKGIHRNAHIVAIGGGALSDFAGFVSATVLRGVSWSVVPTTLLSMVDASIGGKVAINSKNAKNQIGAFHKPNLVLINEGFLETLSEEEIQSGKGEILKYTFLDKEIHSLVSKKKPLIDIILKCAEYKLNLTEKDFKESGLRKILNLGHSLGHCIENIYQIPHGVAVFWGMALVFKLFGEEKQIEDLKQLAVELKFSVGEAPWLNRTFPDDKVMGLLSKDKKIMSNSSIDLVLIKSIGEPIIQPTKLTDIEVLLEKEKNELRQFTI